MDKDKDKEDYCNFFYFFIHIKCKKIIWPPRTLRGQTRKMSYINLGIKKMKYRNKIISRILILVNH